MRVENEPAYLLETRPYRETSLLVEAFTAEHGRIALVAKGVRGAGRRQGARRAALSPFGRVRIGFNGRGEVLTLGDIEADSAPLRPAGPALFAALYVNELVQKLTGRGDPAPMLFDRYGEWLAELAQLSAAVVPIAADANASPASGHGEVSCSQARTEARGETFDKLSQAEPRGQVPDDRSRTGERPDAFSRIGSQAEHEGGDAGEQTTSEALAWSLRRFERDLLALLGYALALTHDSDSGEPLEPDGDYAIDPEHGARRWTAGTGWPRVRGSVLLAWAGEGAPTREESRQLKKLAREVIRHHLGGVELRTWKLAAEWRR